MITQASFSDALLDTNMACPVGMRVWNGSDPATRFSVYRNNVMVSLIDSLADTYPVVQALVGDAFFRAMAREFVRAEPPSSPVLAWYGAGFADFVAGFSPAAGLPYLADVARLEWMRVEALHAADEEGIANEALTELLRDPVRLSNTRFRLHPSVRVLCSSYPVVSLWAAHQDDEPSAALAAIDLGQGEATLTTRPEQEVELILIEPGAADFVAHLHAGVTLASAVAASRPFDLSAVLGLMIRKGLLVGALSLEEAPCLVESLP